MGASVERHYLSMAIWLCPDGGDDDKTSSNHTRIALEDKERSSASRQVSSGSASRVESAVSVNLGVTMSEERSDLRPADPPSRVELFAHDNQAAAVFAAEYAGTFEELHAMLLSQGAGVLDEDQEVQEELLG